MAMEQSNVAHLTQIPGQASELKTTVDDEYHALLKTETAILEALATVGEGIKAFPSFVKKAGISIAHADASAMAGKLSNMSASMFSVVNETAQLHRRADKVRKNRDLEYTMVGGFEKEETVG